MLFNFFKAGMEAPVFSTPLKEMTVEAGNPLELAASINAFSEPVEVGWQKDNKPVNTNVKGTAASCKKGVCKLLIDSCSLADSGEYSITVKNPFGSVTCSSKITIKGFHFVITSSFHEYF